MIEVQLFLIALAMAGLLVGMLISERNRAQSVLVETGKRLRGYLPPDAVPPLRTSRPSASSAHMLEQNTDLLAKTADQIAALNHELQASQERLRNTLAATNRMMSILSHDLKNPLVGIRGLANVLAENEEHTERDARMLRLIQQSTQQALDMVENLLIWSRLDTNAITVAPSRSSLRGMVEECFTLLGGTAQHKMINLLNNVPPELRPYVDPRMITTALRNLLSNAIKFTGARGTVAVVAEPVNEAWVLVAVADTGVGISQDAQRELFNDSTSSHSVPGTDGELGTGLGLQLCDEMIRLHGGVMWVKSKPDEGATFYFTIPRMDNPPRSPTPETVRTTMSDDLIAPVV
jgi:signal transduction histidine kinase